MTPDQYVNEARQLCDICHSFGERGWCRATSGNFSLRVGTTNCLITQSGKEKSRLTPADLMICDFDGQAADPTLRPSAETPLHTRIYELDHEIGAVLHTHSIAATLLSRRNRSAVKVAGYEMQKAFSGIRTHEAEIVVPVFDNNQDMRELADNVAATWIDGTPNIPGFLIRGHGLYAWGNNAGDAERHVEGFEFLFACLWQEILANRR